MYSIENSIKTNNVYPAGVSEKLDKINEQLKDIPKVLDKETLDKFRNGEYDITLEEYTSLSSYRTSMEALYGNSSAKETDSLINKFLGNQVQSSFNAKDFVEIMSERGLSMQSANKLYNAINRYSIVSSAFNYKNNFVSAKI